MRPLDDAVADSATVPLKPPKLARLIVELPLDPERKVTVVGLALILKSGMLTVTPTVWGRLPIVAVIVTV